VVELVVNDVPGEWLAHEEPTCQGLSHDIQLTGLGFTLGRDQPVSMIRPWTAISGKVVVRSRAGIAVPAAPDAGRIRSADDLSPEDIEAHNRRITAATHPALFEATTPDVPFALPEPPVAIETERWTPEPTEPAVDSASPPVTAPESVDTSPDIHELLTVRAEHGSTALHCAICGLVDAFTPRVWPGGVPIAQLLRTAEGHARRNHRG
jgi:hypothetical protein